MTESEKLLHEIERLIHDPILIHGRGINFGPDNKPIKAIDLQRCEVLEIEHYKGFEIKIIIKKLL